MHISAKGYFCLFFLLICSFANHVNLFSMDRTTGYNLVDIVTRNNPDAPDISKLKICPSDDILDSNKLEHISMDEWIDRTSVSTDFTFIANEFIKLMTAMFDSTPWFQDRRPDTAAMQLKNGPRLSYISKLVVPSNTKTEIIGDIHAEMGTITGLLNSLRNKEALDKNMHVPANVRIIFLGDYSDRGGQTFKVLSTVLLLAVKNPGRVFLLKGNHENLTINLKFGIAEEIKCIENDSQKKINLLTLLHNVHNYLCAGMFLGYITKTKIRFQFLVHAGVDLRYDYEAFLKFNNFDLRDENGGIRFWQLDTTNFKTELMNDIIGLQGDDAGTKALVHQFTHPLIDGFIYNDIAFLGENSHVKVGTRGPGSIVQSPQSIAHIAELCEGPECSLDGVEHGHQHDYPKTHLPGSEYDKYTSGCYCDVLDLEHSHWSNTHLLNDEHHKFYKTFTITTLISGRINYKGTGWSGGDYLKYAPTFLSLSMNDDVWQFEAVIDE